ncbi:germination protein YpeB [Paenibacillaceae bacterium]|nr:germination protein YpeB [Paenibacillaceae bacterium]
MYQRLSAVLFPVMTLLLIGTVFWGYQEHQEKNSILIKAENQYQRAFHDLSYHMKQLNNQLGNTLAVNSASQAYHRKGLVNVWRLTSEAQNEINQLPLNLLPFNETDDFLSRVANFSYRTAVRDLTKEPLSDKEYGTLKTLYEKSEELTQDLQAMQDKVLQNSLRWMDVEIALATEQATQDNVIIDGFKSVNKKVSEYPEINWGPSVSAMYEKRTIQMLGGEMVTAQDVQQKAAEFAGIKDIASVEVQENGEGTDYASYTAKVQPNGAKATLTMNYTKRGGQLVWFNKSREIGEKKVSVHDARADAVKFLEEHDYPNMTAVSYDEFGNTGSLTFVEKQGDVLIYPEKLTVKVALDNGETIGLEAADYVFEHKKRNLPKPQMSEAEARKLLNPAMKVSKTQKALIDNDLGDEVLCYEYTGKINGAVFRVYVNADNGLEEMIEKLP